MGTTFDVTGFASNSAKSWGGGAANVPLAPLISAGPDKGTSLYDISKETGWVGSEKWQFLLTFSFIYADLCRP